MSDSSRCAWIVSYLGARYSGWQRQPDACTIQQLLEEALEPLLAERTPVVGAGRTDAGVHARGQVAHFDAPTALPCRALVHAVNQRLPSDIRVHWAGRMPAGFHARKHATGKEYRYRLGRDRVISALDAPFVTPLERRANIDRMARACEVLVGHHDFSAFAKTGGAHVSPWRTLERAELHELPGEIELRFRGDGFLRGMVRAMVGSLVAVGVGRLSIEALADLLSGDATRADAGANAPARGLVLHRVWYPRRWAPTESHPEALATALNRSEESHDASNATPGGEGAL